MLKFVIVALKEGKQAGFYSGKAGEDFVDPLPENAFTGFNAEGANRKAELLNRMSSLHGFTFSAQTRIIH